MPEDSRRIGGGRGDDEGQNRGLVEFGRTIVHRNVVLST